MEKKDRTNTKVSGMEMMRYRIIQEVISKRLTQMEAAVRLDLSVRQVRRIVREVRCNGLEGVVHGLVGKPSNRKFDSALEQQILTLWETKYRKAGFNFSHFTEKLVEVEKIKVSTEKIRTLLRSKAVADQAPKKGRKHRKQRPRRERFGELVQLDTSPHDWLGTGIEYHAVVAIDDATSRLLFVKLYEHDGTMPNMEAIRSIILKYGLPMSLYTDGAGWFKVTRHWEGTINKKKTTEYITQIERALKDLGVELIIAGSAQAKGRVERANETLQDRLIAELRLRQITTLEAANRYIESEFIEDHNTRFAREPVDSALSFVTFLSEQKLDEILCLQFKGHVQNDNTVSRVDRYKLQLLPTSTRLSWAKAPVIVSLLLDGSTIVRHAACNTLIPHEVISLKIPREFKHPKVRQSEPDIFISQSNDLSM